MGYQFWLKWDSEAVSALAAEWTDYKLNNPNKFKKVVAEERQRLESYPSAQKRFERFLKSLPNTIEEAERKEQRRSNLEALRRLLKRQKTRRVKISETTIDAKGVVLKQRNYTTTQYVETAMQAFYEWALEQDSFNTDEFDPAEEYRTFFKSCLDRLPKGSDARVETRGRKKGNLSPLTTEILRIWDETTNTTKAAKGTYGMRTEEMSYERHKDLVIRAIERNRGVTIRKKRNKH